MAITKLHGLYGADIGGTTLGGISRCAIANNPESRADASSAEIYPRHAALTGFAPQAQFTTFALQDALDLVALAGIDVGTTNVNLYAQQYLIGGGREGALKHRKYAFSKGLLIPGVISCDHQGDASLTYTLFGASADGAAAAYAMTELQSLPTGIADNERFTIGGVTLQNIAIDHIRSFELDFGIEAVAEGADSDLFPTFASIRSIRPTLTLRGVDPDWQRDAVTARIPTLGMAAVHANTTIYLRKRAPAGFVADITSEHISLTLDGVVAIDQALDAQGADPAEVSLMLRARYDGTLDPVVIDTTAVIT